MSVIKTQIDIESKEFKDNQDFNQSLLKTLQNKINEVSEGGGTKAAERHTGKGKMLVRDRIKNLLDEDSNLLELSQLAGLDLYDNQSPSAGIVTGIGQVEKVKCMIIANDATVKGGTYFPITVKKHLRAQEIAEKNMLPCIYLVDSGGAYLPLQSEVYPDKEHFGRIFYNQARMSAKGIPQIAVVMGICTAGGAYVPAMCDETVIVKNQGTIFLAGPPLVKAATGEEVDNEELGGGEMHTTQSGVADYLADNDEHALEMTRNIVKHLNFLRHPCYYSKNLSEYKNPQVDLKDVYGVVPKDLRRIYKVKEILARVLDDSEFHEFKPNYGKTLVTGFGEVMGYSVGILANQGILFGESALKAVHFIQLCEKRQIPLVFFQNISGFMVGKKYEMDGIAKHGAKMVTAIATAKVPKITFIIGGSFGAGNYAMCGRAYNPRFLFTWPNSKMSVMGGDQAAFVLSQVKMDQLQRQGKSLSEEEIDEIRAPIKQTYEEEGSPYYGSARLWDDGVIDPGETRNVLGECLSIVQYGDWDSKEGFGLFRM